MASVRQEQSEFPDISITGRMCSGKTYVSDWLVGEVGYARLSFAASLKDIEQYLQKHSPLRALFFVLRRYGNVPFKKWWTLFAILGTCRNIEVEIPKPRKRLQYLGNTIRDHISKSYWLDLAVQQYQHLRPGTHVVFDDARYPNEIACLKELGFVTVKLETFSDVRMRRIKKLYDITDYYDPRLEAESERSCDDPQNKFDYVVINNDDGHAIEVFRDIIVDFILAHEILQQQSQEQSDGAN